MNLKRSTKILRTIALVSMMLTSFGVTATADGPDYFQIIDTQKLVQIYEKPNTESPRLGIITDSDIKLRNRGCKGITPFLEWKKMNPKERSNAKKKAWCFIENNNIKGWVKMEYLREYTFHKRPQLDCVKATHEAELTICADPELIELDNKMAVVYSEAIKVAASIPERDKHSLKELKATQQGWVKGRNDCWKAKSEIKKCILSEYQRRIAYLEVRWGLVKPLKKFRYTCDNARDEIIITRYNTSYFPSVSAERGDKTAVFIAYVDVEPNKFHGDFGSYILFENEQAVVVLDQFKPAQKCHMAELLVSHL